MEENIKYKIVHDAHTLNGVFGRIDYPLHIPKNWVAVESQLSIKYMLTPLSDYRFSHLTVSVNNIAITSIPLDNNNGDSVLIQLPLGSEYFKENANTITIEVYNRLKNGIPCVDDVSPGNWITFLEGTQLNITYSVPEITTISDFLKKGDLIGQPRRFIIPSTWQENELESVLLSHLGKSIPFIINESQDLKDTHLSPSIWFCDYDQLPKSISNLILEEQLGENAYLKLIDMEKQNQLLLVTSKNPEMLKHAGMLLANSSLYSTLMTDEKYLSPKEFIGTQVEPIPFTRELTPIGITLKGPFRQEASFYIPYPNNRTITQGSDIYLKMRYSDNLDFERSLVTVWVNDLPIGSKKLDSAYASGDELRLFVPTDYQLKGNMFIKVGFDLELKDAWCQTRQLESPWAYITPESTITIRSRQPEGAYLEYYPYPLVKDNQLAPLTIILPDELNSSTYDMLSGLWGTLSQKVQNNMSLVDVIKGNQIEPQTYQHNLLVLGTVESNSFLKEHEKLLGTMQLSPMGSIQVLKSPINEDLHMVVITGTNDQMLKEISNLVGKSDNLWQLRGDLLTLDASGAIGSQYMTPPQMLQPQVLNDDPTGMIGLSIILGILLMLGIAMVLLMFRKYWGGKGGKS